MLENICESHIGITPKHVAHLYAWRILSIDADDTLCDILSSIDLHAHETIAPEEAETIAIGDRKFCTDIERIILADGRDLAKRLAYGLGGLRLPDAGLATMGEIVGEAAVETLVGRGRETRRDRASRETLEVGTSGENLVEPLAVEESYIAYIVGILQSPLDLERRDASINKLLEIVGLVVIAEREGVGVAEEQGTVGSRDIIGEAAWLRTLAAVGGSTSAEETHVALAAIRDAQRTMDESLKADGCLAGNVGNLLDRQLASQNHLGETHLLPKEHLVGGTVVALSGSVELDGRHIAREEGGILDDEDINTDVVELPCEGASVGNLIVEEESIESHVDTRAEGVGMAHEGGDIVDSIGSRLAGSELRRTDVDGIGSVINCRNAALKILGRC